jgi:hypothetical protein
MRPNSRQLIESVDWALQNKVLPTVEDKWAASALRSSHCLLQHLAVRVDLEGQLLHDDNADLRSVLAEVADLLVTSGGAQGAEVGAQVADGLEPLWREPGAYPTVASLSEENIALRELVDTVLLAATGGFAAADAQVRAALDAYVRRRLQRDQPLFIPAFLASTF